MKAPIPGSKTQRLLKLFEEWSGCTKCPLHEKRTNIVFPDGNPDADLVVIGIGPGEHEDIEGVPFWGESGGIVNDYLRQIEIVRNEVFFMNIVQCRPTAEGKDSFGKTKIENRDPSLVERKACRDLWEKALYIVDPLLVVSMGKPAAQELTGKRSVIMGEVQGSIDRCTIKGRAVDVTYPVMCMFHPAFLSRSGNMYRGGPWHKAMIAWQRAIYFLDQLRNEFRGTEIPQRPYKRKDMFLIDGGLPK